MSATFHLSPKSEGRPFYLAVIAGLACAFVIGKALPSTMDAVSAIIEPLCATLQSQTNTIASIAAHEHPIEGFTVLRGSLFFCP